MIDVSQTKVNGRILHEEDIEQIKEIVRLYPGLSRQELISTICVNCRWGSIIYTKKQKGIEELLTEMEDKGFIKLPPKRKGNWKSQGDWGKGRKHIVTITDRTHPQVEIKGVINDFPDRGLELVSETDKEDLWDEYIERYHELKYGSPFGDRLKYFIKIGGEKPQYVGCIMFSASSWALENRDNWIGWSKEDRTLRLHLVVNNTRFLIFPWVNVKNLASWALSCAVRRVREDWRSFYRYSPILLETFVDGRKYTGVCYRAANWMYLGETKGHGRQGGYGKYLSSPKQIYMYPLVDDFRDYLTGKKSDGDTK